MKKKKKKKESRKDLQSPTNDGATFAIITTKKGEKEREIGGSIEAELNRRILLLV